MRAALFRRRLGRAFVATIWVATLLASPLGAQLPPSPAPASGSAKVVTVKASGSKKFTSGDIARLGGIAPGSVVTREDIQASADRLGGLGWFNNVQYKFNTTRDGVEIEFTVEDAAAVPVTFDNFPWFTDQELGEAIRAEAGFFDGTAPDGGDGVDNMKSALQKLCAARGIRGDVTATLLAAPGEAGMVQQFHLNGPLTRVGAVEFSDPQLRAEKHVAERLTDVVGKPYSRFALDLFAYEYVRPIYLSQGYLRVRFAPVEARFAGDRKQPVADSVVAKVTVETGPVYKWAGAAWSGNAAFDDASLNKMVGLSPGDAADGNKIEAAWGRLENEYGKRGYIEAKVERQAAFDEAAAKVSYRVAITEGIQYRVGQMVITGLSLAGERQLLAAWALPRGEVFNKQYYEDFVASGARKIFENSAVHFETVGHLLRPNPETKLVDILLDFQ